MARVKFKDGTIINFDGEPSPQDIEEAYNQIDQPKESFGRFLYRENIAPIVSGASTLAFGIPRDVARATGTEELIYPEQRTWQGKALRGTAETVGFIRGGPGLFMKKAGEAISKKAVEGLTRKTLRAGAEGLVGGISLSGTPEERLKTGATFGALSFATPYALRGLAKTGQIITKSGRWVAKNIGGITDASVKVIKDLGVDRVFDPLKAKADYITQNLAPRVYEKINKIIEIADKAYQNAVGNFKGDTINSQSFYQSIQKGLRDKGWIDLRGNPTTRYKSGIDPVIDKLTSIYLSMKHPAEGARLTGQIISKEDFFTYRDALSSMLREKPSDRLVMQARNALYNSAERSGMTGIKIARDLEKNVFEIENKLDVNKISKDLIRAGNPKWTTVVKDEYDKILGKSEFKDIYDDLMAHFTNIDFNLVSETPGAGGGFYPSRSGFLRSSVAGATKNYYKFIKPQLQAVSPLSSAFGRFIARDYPTPQIGISRGISEATKE